MVLCSSATFKNHVNNKEILKYIIYAYIVCIAECIFEYVKYKDWGLSIWIVFHFVYCKYFSCGFILFYSYQLMSKTKSTVKPSVNNLNYICLINTQYRANSLPPKLAVWCTVLGLELPFRFDYNTTGSPLEDDTG